VDVRAWEQKTDPLVLCPEVARDPYLPAVHFFPDLHGKNSHADVQRAHKGGEHQIEQQRDRHGQRAGKPGNENTGRDKHGAGGQQQPVMNGIRRAAADVRVKPYGEDGDDGQKRSTADQGGNEHPPADSLPFQGQQYGNRGHGRQQVAAGPLAGNGKDDEEGNNPYPEQLLFAGHCFSLPEGKEKQGRHRKDEKSGIGEKIQGQAPDAGRAPYKLFQVTG